MSGDFVKLLISKIDHTQCGRMRFSYRTRVYEITMTLRNMAYLVYKHVVSSGGGRYNSGSAAAASSSTILHNEIKRRPCGRPTMITRALTGNGV